MTGNTGVLGTSRFGEGRRRTAHQFVRDTLRHAILTGELAGGTRLVQAEIAGELDVSTTPVREALRDLASEGLIRLDAHRGAIVHKFDLDEAQEIYELRMILEPHCMRQAVLRISSEELAEAERLQAKMDGVEDVAEWVELNRSFHEVLTDACRSPRLIGILKSLRDSAAIYVGFGLRQAPSQFRTGNAEHRALLDAFRAGDPDGAAAAVTVHLRGTRRAMGLPDDG